MADLRIVDAPLLSTVKGTEKIPTGGEGNFSVSVNQVADFAKLKWVLATEGYVDNAVGNVQADLNLHKNNTSNPHDVTKVQVGLGNVDNTADLDKPLSNADIAALSLKADKLYVDSQDQLKADKTYVDTAIGAISTDASKQYATLALANADIANIALNKNIFVSESVNGGYWYKGTAGATTLTKSPYDPLTQAKALFPNTFGTKSLLEASTLPLYAYAIVIDDPVVENNGFYQKNASSLWVKVRFNTDNQVNNFLSKKGFAKVIPNADSNINYDVASSTLTFTGSVYAITHVASYVVATPVSVVMATSGIYRLEFNETTRKLQAVQAGSLKTDGWLVVGFIRRNFDGIVTTLFNNFNVNGAAPISSAKTNYSLIITTPETLNFDFINNKVVVSGNGLWMPYDGGRVAVAAQQVTLPSDRNKGFNYLVLVNPANGTLVIKSQAAPFTMPKDHLVIGAYYEPTLTFYGLSNFSVNGMPYSKTGTVRPSFGWDFNNEVSVNVADEFLNTNPINLGTLTTSVVYGWYDALVAEYPDYITKTLLGNDASGTLPIYQYRFKPKLPSKVNVSVKYDFPKVMLISVHNEGINMVATHILMREICQSWQNLDSLASMRYGLEFVVIPVGNPWGLNNATRKNSNAVDINRNFPAEWIQLGTPADTYYSGTAPLTEAEAQHLYAAMVAEKPDVFYDVHSFGPWNKEGTSAWISELNDKTNSATLSAMTRIYSQYKKKYSWLVDMDKLMDISDETVLGGGTASKSAASVGAIGGTFETAWNLKNSPDDEPIGHSPAVNFTTDLLGTCILQCLGVLISSK